MERNQAEAMEISENLMRNEGTVLEQSMGWARLKTLQEEAGEARTVGNPQFSQNEKIEPSLIRHSDSKGHRKITAQVYRFTSVGDGLNNRPKVVDALEAAGYTDEHDALTKLVGPKKDRLTEEQQLRAIELARQIEAKNKNDKRKLGPAKP